VKDEQGVGSDVSAPTAAGIHHSCDVTNELNYSDIIPRVEEDKER